MRISDWSSDVCSSDLKALTDASLQHGAVQHGLQEAGTGDWGWGVLAPRGRSRCTVLGVTAETTSRHSRERGNPATLLSLGRKDASVHSSDRKSTRLNSSH